jgi:hypothetical protein
MSAQHQLCVVTFALSKRMQVLTEKHVVLLGAEVKTQVKNNLKQLCSVLSTPFPDHRPFIIELLKVITEQIGRSLDVIELFEHVFWEMRDYIICSELAVPDAYVIFERMLLASEVRPFPG